MCQACADAEASVLTHKEYRDNCLGCSSRALAVVYGEYPAHLVEPRMYETWPDTKSFKRGRSAYWAWVKAISEAKEKT